MTTKLSGTSGVSFPDGVTHGSGSGRLINIRVFTTANSGQTYTPTAGTRTVRVKVVGGGGAGGATNATSSNSFAFAQGGNAGGYAESLLPASTVTGALMTIGAGGVAPAGVAAGPANAGGTTSFGTYLSATGGGGGITAVAVTTPVNVIPTINVSPGAGSNGNILNMAGQAGAFPVMLQGGALTGMGGSTLLGIGGPITGASYGVSSNGWAATGYGAGGGGGASSNAGAAAGGAGAPGVIIVEEYA